MTDPEIQLTRLGVEQVNGHEANGIRAQSRTLGTVDLYFDEQTGLLLKSRKTSPNSKLDRPEILDAYVDDFKDVQGAKIPMKIKGVQNDKVILSVELIEARFEEEFEPRTFAKP